MLIISKIKAKFIIPAEDTLLLSPLIYKNSPTLGKKKLSIKKKSLIQSISLLWVNKFQKSFTYTFSIKNLAHVLGCVS